MRILPIDEVAGKLGLGPSDFMPYTREMAKLTPDFVRSHSNGDGKVVLVTAMTPTKYGEGKTLTSIALQEALWSLGIHSLLALREPAIGPVFGIKGGATGSGKATIEPSQRINLHFTGDIHALTAANNLISAVIDNSIFQGNPLEIDPEHVLWKRALDMNDRALRNVEIARGGKIGIPRREEFVITVASELMAILCLALDREDFYRRLGDIAVAKGLDGRAIHLKELGIRHALMELMEDALLPNLVQTQDGAPVLVHGGPFANIAHGANSIIATRLARSLASLVITEAGFGADLGAEKFLDIVCPTAGISPSCVVLVATLKALKLHGGVPDASLGEENPQAVRRGIANVERHYENLRSFGVPVVISLNRFDQDHMSEIKEFSAWAEERRIPFVLTEGYQKGAVGAQELARAVLGLVDTPSNYHPLYKKSEPLFEKVERICTEIYRCNVSYSESALADIKEYEKMHGDYFVCMAKTPNSFTDDPKKKGAPDGETVHVRDVRLYEGARFLVPLLGNIMTMPGLPKVPAAVMMGDE